MDLWGERMNLITERIKYLPATCDPLSADVYFIEGDKYCYIYDVGNDDNSLHHINEVEKEKIVVLSHYHEDHVGNIDCINYRNLYVGKKTYETIGNGKLVEDVITINDGVKIEIIHCTSPHTDGSLILNVDNEYTLIADLYFTRPPFDRDKAIKMIDILNNINTKYFVISHQEDVKIVSKEKLVAELLDYFNQ
jgi:glyoxylase-like metal-dependent hydrolase (beta-lactamase superfamily II)